jgi:hypothetical protein
MSDTTRRVFCVSRKGVAYIVPVRRVVVASVNMSSVK